MSSGLSRLPPDVLSVDQGLQATPSLFCAISKGSCLWIDALTLCRNFTCRVRFFWSRLSIKFHIVCLSCIRDRMWNGNFDLRQVHNILTKFASRHSSKQSKFDGSRRETAWWDLRCTYVHIHRDHVHSHERVAAQICIRKFTQVEIGDVMDCMYVVVEGSLAQFVTKEGCCVPDPVTPVLYRYKFVQTTGIIHDSKIGSAHACTPKSIYHTLSIYHKHFVGAGWLAGCWLVGGWWLAVKPLNC